MAWHGMVVHTHTHLNIWHTWLKLYSHKLSDKAPRFNSLYFIVKNTAIEVLLFQFFFVCMFHTVCACVCVWVFFGIDIFVLRNLLHWNWRIWMTLFMNLLQDFRDVALLSLQLFCMCICMPVWLIYILKFIYIIIDWPLARENIKNNLPFLLFLLLLLSSRHCLLSLLCFLILIDLYFIYFYSFDTKFSILSHLSTLFFFT